MDTSLALPQPLPTIAPAKSALTGLTLTLDAEGYSCPLAYCDMCTRLIKNINHAGVVWEPLRRNGQRRRFRILCKDGGTGTPGYHGCLSSPCYKHQPWMELSTYLMSLLHNLGVKTQEQMAECWERADVLARFE